MTTIPVSEFYQGYYDIVRSSLLWMIIIIGLVAWRIQYVIISPISQLAILAKKVALGDLSVAARKEANSSEIEEIRLTFNEMIRSLKQLVVEIASKNNVLKSAASDLNQMSDTTDLVAADVSCAITVIKNDVGKQAAQTNDVFNNVKDLSLRIEGAKESIDKIGGFLQGSAMAQQINAVNETKQIFEQIATLDGRILERMTSFAETVDYIYAFSKELLEIASSLTEVAHNSEKVTNDTMQTTAKQREMVEQLKKASVGIEEIVLGLEAEINRFVIEEKINESEEKQ